MDFLDPTKLTTFVSALAPGFLIMFVRSQFNAGKPPNFQDRAVTYAAISSIYFAISIPLFAYLRDQHRLLPLASQFFEYFVLPIGVGLILALLTTRRTFDRWWQRIGLQPIHHIPSAWDYLFGGLTEASWIIVTLKDGGSVAGKYGAGSFASSDGGERDLYISEVWDVSEQGDWAKPTSPKGVLLCGRDIRSVEIFNMEGNADE